MSWYEFQELYEPLIRRWATRSGLQNQDVDDITQNVMTVVIRRLEEFKHQKRTGCFRAWLKNITLNCLRTFFRNKKRRELSGLGRTCPEVISQLEDEHSELSRQWNREHDHHVVNKLLERIRPSLSEQNYEIFVETCLNGKSISQVASYLNITENAVSIAKSRVIGTMKKLCDGIVDIDEFARTGQAG